MAQRTIDINALGQCMDTTFGRSSTTTTASSSVKMRLHSNRLIVTYGVMTNVAGKQDMSAAKRRCRDEAQQVIDASLKRLKSDYKDLTGGSIRLHELDQDEVVEVVNGTPYSQVRTILYRLTSVLEVL